MGGIIQTKVSAIERATEKNERNMDEIKDFKAEQRIVNENLKESLAEQKTDLKELLKLMREK